MKVGERAHAKTSDLPNIHVRSYGIWRLIYMLQYSAFRNAWTSCQQDSNPTFEKGAKALYFGSVHSGTPRSPDFYVVR